MIRYIKLSVIAVLFISLGVFTAGGCGGNSNEINVTAPLLITPLGSEPIQQNNSSIGCPFNPISGFGYRIFFDWTDSESPKGIKGYHLIVMNVSAEFPLVNMFVTESEYEFTSCNEFVADSNLNGWTWSVQAEDNSGNLSTVISGEIIFENCSLDRGSPCSTPVPDANVTAPILLNPIQNEIILQNNPDIGCPFEPFRGFGFRVFYDWSDSESPNGIRGYHLFVIQSNGEFPIIDRFVQESEFTNTSCNAFIIDRNIDDWLWSVQAEDFLGILSPVVEGVFTFGPCRLSNGDICSAPF